MVNYRSIECILDDTIVHLRKEYLEDERVRWNHRASRFRECFKKHVGNAMRKFKEDDENAANPALMGKHFSHEFIMAIANHVSIDNYLDLIIGNNPEKPGTEFLAKWGDELNAMDSELMSIAAKLDADNENKDYIVWLHRQEDKRKPNKDIHCSIFSPDELVEAGDRYAELFRLTSERVNQFERELWG